MQIIKMISEMRQWSSSIVNQHPGKKIGLVPTMGFLHDGHLSLIEAIKSSVDFVVVSIFVNPIQFNNPEDLEKYPRDMPADVMLLEKAGVDVLFAPETDEVYRSGYPEIFIDYPKLTGRLCGAHRPGHFSGVLTIVHNLFQWVRPHNAIFGLKDYQQYLLIKKMAADLQMNVNILAGKLIREHDGLAMSSRNVRLSRDERTAALNISGALFETRDLFLKQKSNIYILRKKLVEGLGNLRVEYASIYNPETLEELTENDPIEDSIMAIAAYAGNVRLIDNLFLTLEE